MFNCRCLLLNWLLTALRKLAISANFASIQCGAMLRDAATRQKPNDTTASAKIQTPAPRNLDNAVFERPAPSEPTTAADANSHFPYESKRSTAALGSNIPRSESNSALSSWET